MDRMQQLQWRMEVIDLIAMTTKSVANVHQDRIDQIQLPVCPLFPAAPQVIEYPSELAGQGFGQALGNILGSKRTESAFTLAGSLRQGPHKALETTAS